MAAPGGDAVVVEPDGVVPGGGALRPLAAAEEAPGLELRIGEGRLVEVAGSNEMAVGDVRIELDALRQGLRAAVGLAGDGAGGEQQCQ